MAKDECRSHRITRVQTISTMSSQLVCVACIMTFVSTVDIFQSVVNISGLIYVRPLERNFVPCDTEPFFGEIAEVRTMCIRGPHRVDKSQAVCELSRAQIQIVQIKTG